VPIVRLRQLWRDIHLWIGIATLVVFIPLGLSGSWLVFDEPIDRAQHPQRYQATALRAPPGAADYTAYFEAARTAFGDRGVPAQLRMGERGAPVRITAERGLTAWIDPATAQVLDVGNTRTEFRGVMHQLHGNLMLGREGRQVVGWLGVAMFISCATGLYLWWPRGAFVSGLRWRRSPILWSNIHHLTGFWICVPLAVLALTGAAVAFPNVVVALTGSNTPPQERRREQPPALPQTRTNAGAAVAAALPLLENARITQIQAPTARQRAWRIEAGGRERQIRVSVDDATGAARLAEGGGRAGAGGGRNPTVVFMRQLHDATIGGPVWQWIVFLGGLAPTILGVTGLLYWLRRRRRPAQPATAEPLREAS
jgi:uncharacterized iron-regulated membrane protein